MARKVAGCFAVLILISVPALGQDESMICKTAQDEIQNAAEGQPGVCTTMLKGDKGDRGRRGLPGAQGPPGTPAVVYYDPISGTKATYKIREHFTAV